MDQDLLVRLHLVKFASCLDPDEDSLIKWLIDLNFWDFEVRCRVRAANNYLPLDKETAFMEMFGLPLCRDSKNLFSNLLSSDVGLSLKALGFDGCQCNDWEDIETCTGKLLYLKLARVQYGKKLKALKIAFDPRAQFLIGARKVPYA
ncbi:MAG: hypothetical protein A2427_03170 [Candidatus Nealsonbacteria bacterium RIFOXYC1_FULL_40_7]|uniref:Uncharacterized protein n=1 Tax=Candidatus Nealsonbacteria bacterium RIFOXYC1_FULL_40_7 TaxID=1801678 RepID=A0A1G2ENE5_9BACT|nr:MAG: hypothetical protein A2427_03170 [Candidatus Nealsonbacteria bacterium RIFOXYC1_FULL_40_7]